MYSVLARALHEQRQPMLALGPAALDQPMHALDLAGAAGYDSQLCVETLQIELADDAVVSLLDQKHARTGLQSFFYEPELALAQTEAGGVFFEAGVRIRKQHLGRRLLDDRAADRAVEHVTGTLGGHANDAVELAPGLRPLLGKALERRIRQQPPEFIHPANQAPTIEQLAYQMEQIQCDRRARQLVIQQ